MSALTCHPDLHSTMSLFKRRARNKKQNVYGYLHSTMSLFKLERAYEYGGDEMLFTFHFVSI